MNVGIFLLYFMYKCTWAFLLRIQKCNKNSKRIRERENAVYFFSFSLRNQMGIQKRLNQNYTHSLKKGNFDF